VSRRRLQYLILAADLFWILIAMCLAYLLRYGLSWYGPDRVSFLVFVPSLVVSLVTWVLVSSSMKLDGFCRGWYVPAIVSQLALGVTLQVLVLLACGYIVRAFVSRLTLGYFGVLSFAGFVAIRYVTHTVLGSAFRVGAVRRVAIVGSGPVACEVAAKLRRHPEMLREVVGFLGSADSSFDSGMPAALGERIPVQTLGVLDLLRNQRVDEIIITVPRPDTPEIMSLASRCRSKGIGVSVVPHPYELYLSKPQLLDLGGLPLLQWHDADTNFAYAVWKRSLDLALGTVLLILCLPFVLLGAVLLARKERGPFCREPRCGQFGQEFRMWRLNSDRDRSNLTRCEIILQQLSITELPQLWDVLRGEMSLVGPRPESPERVKHYSDWQRQRLNVKPGMTGLAQVHGLREHHSSEEKARFDLQYMLHPSPFLDVSLLLQTVWTLLGRLVRLNRIGRSSGEPVRPDFLEGGLPRAHSTQPSAD
jgi:lipopolysaccharide/colanic/teichoic acid biosynthesis glycosyltransferase